jgi:hypothetical protein
MKRRLFKLAAAGSLVMMLAMLALSVRSATTMDILTCRPGDNPLYYFITSSRGGVSVGQGAPLNYIAGWPGGVRWETQPVALDPFFDETLTLGFRFSRIPFRSLGFMHPDLRGRDSVVVTVPDWFLISLCAIPLPVIAFRWWRRRQVGPSGLCRACGYDLRATPDQCPECGMAIAPKSSKGAA